MIHFKKEGDKWSIGLNLEITRGRIMASWVSLDLGTYIARSRGWVWSKDTGLMKIANEWNVVECAIAERHLDDFRQAISIGDITIVDSIASIVPNESLTLH